MWALFSRLLTVFGYLAALGVAVVVFALLTARMVPVVDLFAQFLLPTIVAAIGLTALALATRRWRLATLSGALLASCVLIAWPYQWPASSETTQRPVKLLMFNVFLSNPQLPEAAKHVRALDADIVILLEVTPRIRKAFAALYQDYPYRIECWQKTRCDILLLSRVPLTDLEPTIAVRGKPPAWAAAELEHDGCRFSLVAAHMSLPFPYHRPGEQGVRAEALAKIIATVPSPKIVAGDFNAAPWGAIVTDIVEAADLHLLTGFGATWPTSLPVTLGIPIDHVMASPGVTFASRTLVNIPGSDHRAVLTEIALPSKEMCLKSS